jgi:uncharacterized protein
MKYSKPFIHLFRTIGDYYIFDVNTTAILKIEKEVFHYLENLLGDNGKQKNLTDAEIQKANNWVKKAQEEGFLSSKRIKQITHYGDPYLEGLLDQYMENLILQVTQACNLRCKYCPYSGTYENRRHTELSMPEEIAKKAIDYLIDHSSEMPRLAFGFYGGEPFLNFALIKKLTPYIKQKTRGKEYGYFITTNGTVMNDEIIQFLVENDVNLFVSLDGPKEVHDRNRCFGSGGGTFDVVMKNIEKVKKFAPEYVKERIKFNAVFVPEVPFCPLSQFFTDFESIKDTLVMANNPSPYYRKDKIEKEQLDENPQYWDDVEYESLKYMLYKKGRLKKSDVSKIIYNWEERDRSAMEEKREIGIELPDSFHPAGPCVPGSRKLFVTINGELFPCERLSETSKVCKLGTLDSGIDIEKARKFLNIGRLTEEECKNCWAARFCQACIASADNQENLDKKLKLSYCRDFKTSAEAKLRKYCTYKEFGISTEKSLE